MKYPVPNNKFVFQYAFIGFVLLLLCKSAEAQVTLGFQGGEAGDTWTYTSTGANSEAITESMSAANIVSGVASLVAGGNTGGGSCWAGGSGNGPSTARTFTFSALAISGSNAYTRTLTFNWGNRQPACNGTGWDSGENLVFTAYHDGVAQSPVTLAVGNNNAVFDIHSNQYTWPVPPCVNSFYFVISVTTNRRDELLFLDNVKLTTPANNPVLAQPSAINGNAAPCPATTETYSVTQVATVKYTWSGLPPGASFTTPNGTASSYSVGVNWGTVAAGTYTLTVTPSDACNTTTGPAQTLVVTVPAITAPVISGNSSFCPGDSVLLNSNYTSNNSWSTSESTSFIYVHNAGTYSLSVNTACGVLSTSHVVVMNPAPDAAITPGGPTTFCAGGSVLLSSASAAGNAWSTGGTGTSITATGSGIYSLIVTNSCGRDSSAITITVIPASITAAISTSGPINLCPGDSVILTSSQPTGNSWSTGETTTSIVVHSSGSYTLNVSNACASDAATQVISSTAFPSSIITPNGPTTFCHGNSVVLSSSASSGNAWSTGSSSTSIVADSSGTYALIVSNSCGMDSSAVVVTVIPDTITAMITATGPLHLCPGDSVVLSSNQASGNNWSTGETTSSITVHSAGTYTLTTSTSCASDATTQVISATSLPSSVITAGGPTTFCSGSSVTLSSAAVSGNTWSTGATGSSILADSSGTYSLIVSNACGTDSSAVTVTVIADTLTASVTASGPLNLCAGDSVVLTSNCSTGNNWSTGETTQSITVHSAGTYTLAVSLTCAADTTTQVIGSIPPPSSVISASGPLTFCNGNTVTLSSSSVTGNSWSTGSTGTSITVNNSGIYSLLVSNACGTDSSAVSVTVLPDTITAVITASGPLALCPGDSVVLTSNQATGNLWSTGATTPFITVHQAGTYALTTSTACASSSDTVVVMANAATTASISASGPTTFCQGGSVILSSAASSGNSWSTGASTSSIAVSTAGTYTLTVAGVCGSASATQQVVVNTLPTVGITPTAAINLCTGDSALLTASGGSSYLWSNGATGNFIYVHTAGTYSVTSINSCGSVTSVPVTVNALALPVISVSGGGTICAGDSLLLTASGGGPYHWNTGAGSASIYATNQGTYIVSSTNSCGTVSATAHVQLSSITALFSADTLTGAYPLSVQFSNASSNAISYSWNFGDGNSSSSTSPSHVFANSGVYTVTLTGTNTNGCSSTYTLEVVVTEQPSSLAVPNIFTPNGDGTNDLFLVRYEHLQEFHLQIFDRWGLKITEIEDAAKGWDGKTASGKDAADGVYFYIIKATGQDQKNFEQSGYVTLSR